MVTISERPVPPHALTAEAVAALLDVRPEAGLNSVQVLERLARYGPNRLPEAPPRSPWRVLLGQFRSILILILIGAALLAALVGSFKDALVILAVVVINALVGFYQEYRAERSLDALEVDVAHARHACGATAADSRDRRRCSGARRRLAAGSR